LQSNALVGRVAELGSLGIMDTVLVFTVPISFISLCLLLPICFVAWTGRWKRGVFLTWACLIIWFIFASLLCAAVGEKLAERLQLPDMPSIVPAVLIGWLPSMLIAGLGFLARVVLSAFWPWFATKTGTTHAPDA